MKTTLIAALLALTPALGFAMGCSSKHETAMSCAEGSIWNAEAGACTPLASS